MFFHIHNFYPTPVDIAQRMKAKLKNQKPNRVLDPEAGKADLVEGMFPINTSGYGYYRPEIFCIEIDPELQAYLRGKNYNLLDTDFLQYSGMDSFDCIVMNPPFDEGHKHLLKAIEIMYRGEIVCQLNAETLRNPCDKTRKYLLQRLEELNADIEYIKDAYIDAERKTGVEIAIVHIEIHRDRMGGLFDDCEEKAAAFDVEIEDKHEISNGRTIDELVASYNETVQACIRAATDFFKYHNKVANYIALVPKGELSERHPNLELTGVDITEKLQSLVNKVLKDARKRYWNKVLDLKVVNSRMTAERRKEFAEAMETQQLMEFTESNVRQFILNIIGSYEMTLRKAVSEIFDRFTIKHSFHEELRTKNIHYFDGWKTNNAYKVGPKVIIPVYGSYGGSFWDDIFQKWYLNCGAIESLHDIDVVMNYFDGMAEYTSLVSAIMKAFEKGENKGSSTYFDFVCHKKGTLHITFRDPDILRRFNVCACQENGSLPHDYGSKSFSTLSLEYQELAKSFEGEKSYEKHVAQPLFPMKNDLLRIAA